MNHTQKIPFNLEKALDGDTVITRYGLKVTQLTQFDIGFSENRLVGVLHRSIYQWRLDGSYVSSSIPDSVDLFMAPKIMQRWVRLKKITPASCATEHKNITKGEPLQWESPESMYVTEPILLNEWNEGEQRD